MEELLNPLHPKNPSQQIQETSKKTTKKKEKTYYENSEGVYLPSRGLFYLGDYNKLEYLKVRPLDYTDEDILTTESYYTNGTIFNELLKNTIIDDNGFQAKDLVPIDRDTILLWLRSTAFGNEFKVEFTCPNCGHGNGQTKMKNGKPGPGEVMWNLSELEVPDYKEEVYDELSKEGCLTIVTPMTETKIKIIVPTVGMTQAIDKRYQEKKKREHSTNDFFATSTLLSVVSGVEIEEGRFAYDKMDIDAYFRKIRLPISDSRYILKRVSDISLKYNTSKTFVCKDCGHIQEGVELPILHKNFFWPESE